MTTEATQIGSNSSNKQSEQAAFHVATHRNGHEPAMATLAPSAFQTGRLETFLKYKVVFLGDQAVGKTSIISRFIYDTFDTSYQATIGIDFSSKIISIDDKVVRLQLWDTAGLERFRGLIPSYIRNSNISIVVYDITNRQSFESIHCWVESVRAERGTDVVLIMVGNKCDLSREKRVVSTEEGEIRAKELGMSFVETSAKTGTNIKSLFLRITSEIYLNASGKPSPPNAFIANVDISKGSSSADRKSSGEPGGSCC